ncbi:MAG: hypothetical protein JW994_05140 [Candidatus Omnitrophica bacterium]|nr:hypothetical protein [Candidatus Omnitrophota bacterium]
MREIVYKNLITPASKKRDISVEETVEKNGVVSTTTKRSLYFVRTSHAIQSQQELHSWISWRKKDPELNKKFFHILRKYSSKDKTDKLICKIRGSFYVVSDRCVYDVVFVHAIKICLHKVE